MLDRGQTCQTPHDDMMIVWPVSTIFAVYDSMIHLGRCKRDTCHYGCEQSHQQKIDSHPQIIKVLIKKSHIQDNEWFPCNFQCDFPIFSQPARWGSLNFIKGTTPPPSSSCSSSRSPPSSSSSFSASCFCQLVGTVGMNGSKPCGELRMQMLWRAPGPEHMPDKMPE